MDTIVIFTAKLARKILKSGASVLVDIKPDKSDPSGKRSVFVFEKTEALLDMINNQNHRTVF